MLAKFRYVQKFGSDVFGNVTSLGLQSLKYISSIAMKSKSAIFSYIVMCRHVLQAVLYLKNKSQYLFYEQYLL